MQINHLRDYKSLHKYIYYSYYNRKGVISKKLFQPTISKAGNLTVSCFTTTSYSFMIAIMFPRTTENA